MDYAHIGRMISVEIEGGLWINGRHNRANGMIGDIEKYNEATIKGWRIIRITPDMIKKGIAYSIIERCLDEL